MFSKFQCAMINTEEEYCVFYNWFPTTRQCVLLLTEGPGPINVCKKANTQCTYVQCQPGMIKQALKGYGLSNLYKCLSNFKVSLEDPCKGTWCTLTTL